MLGKAAVGIGGTKAVPSKQVWTQERFATTRNAELLLSLGLTFH